MDSSRAFDVTFVKALAHPLRWRILGIITDRGEASPLELAGELGQSLATVSHHTRVLRDLGCIELARTEQRRGAVEHYYRAIMRPLLDDEQWATLPAVARRGISGQLLSQIFDEAATAGSDGGFDQRGAHLIRVPLELDEEGWNDLSTAVAALFSEAQAIQERSARRQRDLGADAAQVRHAELALLFFALADGVRTSAPEQERTAQPGLSSQPR
jgi:DNA-binding transcriptional ArsR family regulator